MAAARSRSSGQRFQPSHALPEGSLKIVGETCSRNQVSLVTLSPSFWWPAVATPQRKSAGKDGSVMGCSQQVELGCESLQGPLGGGVARLVQEAVQRAAVPDEDHVAARVGQLGREPLRRGPQPVTVGGDDHHRRQAAQVVAAREGVRVRQHRLLADVVGVEGAHLLGREGEHRRQALEQAEQLSSAAGSGACSTG